jgi:hypothetical protein
MIGAFVIARSVLSGATIFVAESKEATKQSPLCNFDAFAASSQNSFLATLAPHASAGVTLGSI